MYRSSIRRRLLLAFALPVVALAMVSWLRVLEAGDRAAATRTEASTALAAGGPSTLITALMDERNITAIELLALEDAVTLRVESSEQAIRQTDDLLAEFKEFLAGNEPEVRAAYEEAVARFETDAAAVRARARAYDGPRHPGNMFADGVYADYTALIARFHTANDQSIARIDDAELRNRARAIANLSVTSDLQSQMARFAQVALTQGGSLEHTAGAAGIYAEWNTRSDEAVRLLAAAPRHQAVVAGFYERPNQHRYEALVQKFLYTETPDPISIITEAADDAAPNAAHAWGAARASIVDRADEMTSATDADRRNAVIAFLAFLIPTIGIALLAARSLSAPLLRLAEQARQMSTTRLPAAVSHVLATATGEDVQLPELESIAGSGITEVDEVAEALNSVQLRAVELAAEQATLRHNSSESLVNLGRRMQGLVSRQLEFLSDVESREWDVARLEELYRVDHLATRIRRNAESLVVLAGSNKTQRRHNAGPPVSVTDVIRGAIAEVEQFDRVTLHAVEPVDVSGQASGDLAHLLAELLENGLAFSPPQTEVTVSGTAGADGCYLLHVIDRGIGMEGGALAEANERLAGDGSFATSPSRYLGHYVVGHLADRHGISVTVASNTFGGVTATVTLPPAAVSQRVAAVEDVFVGACESDGPVPGDGLTERELVTAGLGLEAIVAGRRSLDEHVRMSTT